MSEALSIFLQQNILVLLSYYDEQAKIIRGTVNSNMFEAEYREIAERLYSHLDRERTTPKDHLQELFEDILLKPKTDKAQKRAKKFGTILYEIYENRNKVNVKYTIDRLERFIRHQEIMRATLAVAEIVEGGQISEENIRKAEEIFSAALKKRARLFDPGTFLGDSNRSLAFLERDREIFRTGVSELDKHQLGPTRKALHLFIGLSGRGKTWWLINLGREAFLDGYKVLHITLEMSEEQISMRYNQALFAIAKARKDREFTRTKFRIGMGGELKNIRIKSFTPKHAFDDPDIHKYLSKKHRRITNRLNRVVIKEFPTGQLTLRNLEAYLDNLEAQHQFVPDILLLDYPKLMALSMEHLRIDLGKTVENIRGIAMQRNMAAAVVSQSHRESIKEGNRRRLPVITGKDIAEDFSQVMTADTVLSYNQTAEEEVLKLARLHVVKAREEETGLTVLITQNYALGQFCMRSVRMEDATKRLLLDRLYGEHDEEEEDEET